MKRARSKYIIVFLLILSVVFVGLIIYKTIFNNKLEPYQAIVYKENSGYGYRIMHYGKLLIKQDFIPTVQSNQPFCNYEDAQKIADLVLQKLNKQENPKILISELKEYQIKLNCIN
ncbi:hypothetical protein APS56_01325 [Pseudalgibacter alginicilyticus]|uniref:DUF4907 domain-containing protein n=1 Tax=Pseudalgibacter alginicilyticus TaxID=1736674 RepID=A0A0P0CZZ1_9FLAO|nr:DUF4907 domain-containing protein [Pseudalgibacter alginicilyticus]ALJ03873.1 hypothetical protein APS56_01325 [Pseudalgibacter alginicilyticus]